MRTPQDVLAPLTDSALFLTLTVSPGLEAAAHEFLPALAGLIRSVAFPHPDEDLHCVLGISSDAWDRLLHRQPPVRPAPVRRDRRRAAPGAVDAGRPVPARAVPEPVPLLRARDGG